MFDLLQSDLNLLSGSARLIAKECAKRGWRVYGFSQTSSSMIVERTDKKQLHIISSIPPSLSYISGVTVNNKDMTSTLLSLGNIRQLACMNVTDETTDNEIEEFLAEFNEVVVKPLDGSHGNGITLGVSNIDEAKRSIKRAAESSITARVILQEMVEGKQIYDVRVLCIGGKFVGAIHRIPAQVHGDGEHTLGELIHIENSTFRGEAYKTKFAYIDDERAERYLGKSIDNIPRKDEIVRVIDVANYGAGGELVDVTDEIPEWMKEEAIKAGNILDLPVAGVDYLVTSDTIANATSDKAVIIEVNKGPSLAIHDEPTVGVSRQATQAYVDLLEQL